MTYEITYAREMRTHVRSMMVVILIQFKDTCENQDELLHQQANHLP